MLKVVSIPIIFMLFGCELGDGKMEEQALFEAIEEGQLELVQSILNSRPTLVHARDEYEMTPLMVAVSSSERSVKIIKAILDSGADVNYKTLEGYTPLHMMVDVNGPSGTGRTPYEIANLLVKYGAKTEIRQHWGWTPLMRAALEGTDDEFIAILNVGADTEGIYPGKSLPEFTRGADILEIVISEPRKVQALIKAGYPVDEKHIISAESRIKEAVIEQSAGKYDKEWSNKYIADIKQSMGLIENAIKP